MTFEEKVLPPLSRLCHKLIDAQQFVYVESLANFLNALSSGRWRDLPTDEKLFWVQRLQGILGVRALGDTWDLSDSDREMSLSILEAELNSLNRMLK